jgi:HlyD family secretion protein
MDVLSSNMDVPKVREKRRLRQPPVIIGAAALAVLVVAVLVSGLFASAERKVPHSQVLVGTVQRGDLQVMVDGYGVLRSNEQALITAQTSATVQEVVLRPGARVTKDSVILRLSNPDLMQEVEAARIALLQEQADLRRGALTNEREQLSEQGALAKVRTDYEVQKMRNEALKKFAAEYAIAKLDYQSAVANEGLLLEQVKLQEKRVAQLKLAARESQIIQQEKINETRTAYQAVQQRADRLTVRAGIDGILQRLPVELGQSVTAGQQLALVGSDQNLLALVRISQSKADRLKIGQPAEINTRREKVAGIVTRVAPEVQEGTVEVEIKFKNGVPASARPELNVDARILTATLHDVLFMERPTSAQANSSGTLFLLEPDGKAARAQNVQFGEESGRYISLISGAQLRDQFILSDTNAFREATRIVLVN